MSRRAGTERSCPTSRGCVDRICVGFRCSLDAGKRVQHRVQVPQVGFCGCCRAGQGRAGEDVHCRSIGFALYTGVFFVYDFHPIKIVHKFQRMPFVHFLVKVHSVKCSTDCGWTLGFEPELDLRLGRGRWLRFASEPSCLLSLGCPRPGRKAKWCCVCSRGTGAPKLHSQHSAITAWAHRKGQQDPKPQQLATTVNNCHQPSSTATNLIRPAAIAIHQAPTVQACRNTCFWGLLVGVLKHSAACRSTLKIGLGVLGKKCRTKISIPSLSTHVSEMANTVVVKCCICDGEDSVQFLELTICSKPVRDRGS